MLRMPESPTPYRLTKSGLTFKLNEPSFHMGCDLVLLVFYEAQAGDRPENTCVKVQSLEALFPKVMLPTAGMLLCFCSAQSWSFLALHQPFPVPGLSA